MPPRRLHRSRSRAVLERFFGELLFERGALKAALEFVTFFLDRAECVGKRQLLVEREGVELAPEGLDLGVLASGALLQLGYTTNGRAALAGCFV